MDSTCIRRCWWSSSAALALNFMHFNNPRKISNNRDSQKESYLGPSYTFAEVTTALDKASCL